MTLSEDARRSPQQTRTQTSRQKVLIRKRRKIQTSPILKKRALRMDIRLRSKGPCRIHKDRTSMKLRSTPKRQLHKHNGRSRSGRLLLRRLSHQLRCPHLPTSTRLKSIIQLPWLCNRYLPLPLPLKHRPSHLSARRSLRHPLQSEVKDPLKLYLFQNPLPSTRQALNRSLQRLLWHPPCLLDLLDDPVS